MREAESPLPVAPLTVPVLAGDTIVLRPFDHGDIDAVLDASLDPLIPRITTVPAYADPDGAAAFIARQHERAATATGWSFAIAAHGECVGQIGLWPRDLDHGRASIGYWIRPSRRHRGHAADALRTLTDWAFELPAVERLQLCIEPANIGSWRTAERAGYEREGLLRSWERVGDERRDMLMYAKTRAERRA